MYFFSFIITFFLATLLSLSVECEDLKLTKFGRKVDLLLSHEAKNKNFNQNYKSPKEIEKTLEILPKNFTEAIGAPLKPCRVKRVNNAITDLLESGNKNGLFVAYTTAIARTLKTLGILDSSDVNELAGRYVDDLDKTALTVPDDYSLIDTFPALVISQGRFLKSEGVTSKKDADLFIKFLTEEIEKSTPKKVADGPSTTLKTVTDDSSTTPKAVTGDSSKTDRLTKYYSSPRIRDLLTKLKELLKSKGLTLPPDFSL